MEKLPQIAALKTTENPANTYKEILGSLYEKYNLEREVLKKSLDSERVGKMKEVFQKIGANGNMKIVESDKTGRDGTDVILRKEVNKTLSGKTGIRLSHGADVQLVGKGMYQYGEGADGRKHIYVQVRTSNNDIGWVASEHLSVIEKIPVPVETPKPKEPEGNPKIPPVKKPVKKEPEENMTPANPNPKKPDGNPEMTPAKKIDDNNQKLNPAKNRNDTNKSMSPAEHNHTGEKKMTPANTAPENTNTQNKKDIDAKKTAEKQLAQENLKKNLKEIQNQLGKFGDVAANKAQEIAGSISAGVGILADRITKVQKDKEEATKTASPTTPEVAPEKSGEAKIQASRDAIRKMIQVFGQNKKIENVTWTIDNNNDDDISVVSYLDKKILIGISSTTGEIYARDITAQRDGKTGKSLLRDGSWGEQDVSPFIDTKILENALKKMDATQTNDASRIDSENSEKKEMIDKNPEIILVNDKIYQRRGLWPVYDYMEMNIDKRDGALKSGGYWTSLKYSFAREFQEGTVKSLTYDEATKLAMQKKVSNEAISK